jgi:hypothetical protein
MRISGLKSPVPVVFAEVIAVTIACVAAFASGASASAFQTASGPAGHWVGTLNAGPGIEMEVDLASKGPDSWYGTISIPSQGTKGMPLADLTVKGIAVSFAIKGAPGDPRFSGTLSPDGKTITGDFSQGGGTLPLSLAWKGEPKFDVPAKSTPITKELEGSWEGPLDVKGTILRLALKLEDDPAGAKGSLFSLDQGNIEIPVATVTQDGSRVTLIVTMISGTFDGELKGGELTGTWKQGPLTLPLVFKRTTK